MSSSDMKFMLRRWAAGKHTTKAQLQAFHDDGLVHTLDNGETRLTPKGVDFLKENTP